MTKLANVQGSMCMSNEMISTVSSAENIVSDLKGINKDNVAMINDSKINGQYVPFIAHVAKFPRTASGNVSKQVTAIIYDDLVNHCGMAKASAKMLKENAIKFCEVFEVSTQATETAIKDILESNEIDTQTKLIKAVSGKAEVTLAEKIAKMVYGKDVTKKIDGIEQTIFVPTDLTMDEIQQIEEHMADIKRVRISTDEANASKLSEVTLDNSETNEVLDAMVG